MNQDIIDFDGIVPLQKKKYEEQLSNYVDQLFSDIEDISEDEIHKKTEYSNLLEKYLYLFRRTMEDDNSDIIPVEFSISDMIDKKIEILNDCINNGTLIRESSYYPQIVEGTIPLEEIKKGL